MHKQVIEVASTDGREPPLYFLGYADRTHGWEPLWTSSRTKARWFDPDEAATEIRLLVPHVESRRVVSVQPLTV